MGAPLFTGYETVLVDGFASYRMPRSWHEECRVFVEQSEGFVSCAEATAEQMCQRRHIRVSGMKGATLRFLFESGKAEKVRFLHNPQAPFLGGDWLEPRLVAGQDGDYLEVVGVSGDVLIQLRC